MVRVLLVDDDRSFREVMQFHLEEAGIAPDVAQDGQEALEAFRSTPYDVVITDLKMPRRDGLSLLEEVRRIAPDTLVIVITAFGDVETAVGAMKRGAHDFIPKPTDRDHFVLVVTRALELAQLKSELRTLRQAASGTKDFVFASDPMRQLLATLDRVAESEASVLLLGESGTGKELLANRLHRLSPRAAGPFVAINCAAIPRDLMESELFGHRRGAFTGAVADHKGRFEQANGGTLFLDEVAELPLDLQPRLLRTLQERTVDVVGGSRPVAVDVRIIAATNRDLSARVADGRFREDLFYRLNIIPLAIPPLRDRPEDILPLARHFLARFAPGRELRLHTSLVRRLEGHSWPGNARELENICQRLALLGGDGELDDSLLPEQLSAPLPPGTVTLAGAVLSLPPSGLDLAEFEAALIRHALAQHGGNRSATARFLGLPRHKLLYRMEKYGIDLEANG